jgi:arabinogalactan endo-1,4-beta-galactosidase
MIYIIGLCANPISGQYDLSYVLAIAKCFAKKKYHIYLDFLFSNMGRPTPQHRPSRLDHRANRYSALLKTLRTYVHETIMTFKHAAIDLSLVSLGNEIRNGML